MMVSQHGCHALALEIEFAVSGAGSHVSFATGVGLKSEHQGLEIELLY